VFRELSVAEQRYQAVLAVVEDGLQVTEAAATTDDSGQPPQSHPCARRRQGRGYGRPAGRDGWVLTWQ
jgi:hypothetical protein